MNYAIHAKAYRQIATQTATPGQLVLMLYDGAIGFLERALVGFQNDDPLECNQTIHNNLVRAQAIIQELNFALNMEAGGELSATLRRLYQYFDERLHESNLTKKPGGVRDVVRRLTVLRDAWAEMLRQEGHSRPTVALAAEG
jgi:flagellar secretion chaperone FliS